MLAGHVGQRTQDFVLHSGTTCFSAANAASFLVQQRLVIKHLAQVPESIKAAASVAARVTNDVLRVAGLSSAKLDLAGGSRIHPLAEAYYSQAPIRYGKYIAKLSVVPVSPVQKAMAEARVRVGGTKNPNAPRTATVQYFNDNDAEFGGCSQLCTDLGKMPVEDAATKWSETEGPVSARCPDSPAPAECVQPGPASVGRGSFIFAVSQPGSAPALGVADAGAATGLPRTVAAAPGNQQPGFDHQPRSRTHIY